MCEPVTLGVLTTALTTAGTVGAGATVAGVAGATATTAGLTLGQALAIGASVGSGVMAASSMYQQGQVQKQVARNNATMAEYAAQDAQRRGEEQVQSIQRKASQLQGTQRSMMASRGLDLGVGTAADIVDSTDFFAEQDVATTRYNAARDAWSSRAQGRDMRTQGDWAARNANAQAFGTMLGTAGSVAGKWDTYTRRGP